MARSSFLFFTFKVPITRKVILNFEHLCSLKNFCEEIKVILRSTHFFGNLRLISVHIYSKRSD